MTESIKLDEAALEVAENAIYDFCFEAGGQPAAPTARVAIKTYLTEAKLLEKLKFYEKHYPELGEDLANTMLKLKAAEEGLREIATQIMFLKVAIQEGDPDTEIDLRVKDIEQTLKTLEGKNKQ